MAERKYPLVLVSKMAFRISHLEPLEYKPYDSKVIYNDAEYESYMNTHINGTHEIYDITERKPTWKELKGKWFFARIYYWIPKWLIGTIGVVLGYLISNWKDILELIKQCK